MTTTQVGRQRAPHSDSNQRTYAAWWRRFQLLPTERATLPHGRKQQAPGNNDQRAHRTYQTYRLGDLLDPPGELARKGRGRTDAQEAPGHSAAHPAACTNCREMR